MQNAKCKIIKLVDEELAKIKKTNPELAEQIEIKREYFERCLTTRPYRPAPSLNVELFKGNMVHPVVKTFFQKF